MYSDGLPVQELLQVEAFPVFFLTGEGGGGESLNLNFAFSQSPAVKSSELKEKSFVCGNRGETSAGESITAASSAPSVPSETRPQTRNRFGNYSKQFCSYKVVTPLE